MSGVFLVDLSALMATLNDTDPHFVRQVQALDSMTVPSDVLTPCAGVLCQTPASSRAAWSRPSSCTNSPVTESWRASGPGPSLLSYISGFACEAFQTEFLTKTSEKGVIDNTFNFFVGNFRYAILARNKLTGSDDHQMVKLVVSR